MTRAQMEAARKRVAGVLAEYGPGYEVLHAGSMEKVEALCSRLVTAVLGHPDGRAPRAKRRPPWPRRASR